VQGARCDLLELERERDRNKERKRGTEGRREGGRERTGAWQDSHAQEGCQQAACFRPCTRAPDFVVSRRFFTIFATAPRTQVRWHFLSSWPRSRKSACSTGPHVPCARRATSSLLQVFPPPPSEGYHRFQGPHISSPTFFLLLGEFSVLYSRFLRGIAHVPYIEHVLAHSLIFGSVHHLYASSIYVLCLPAPSLFFFTAFTSCVFLLSLRDVFVLSLFPSLSVSRLLGVYTDFLSGGLSIWRAVFLSVFSFYFLLGMDQLLFATRGSSPFYWRSQSPISNSYAM